MEVDVTLTLNWRTALATVFIVMLGAVPHYDFQMYVEAQELSFDHKVIQKLASMTHTTYSRVDIHRVNEKELAEWYRGEVWRKCIAFNGAQSFTYCHAQRNSAKAFIKGRWKMDKNDPRHIEIYLHKEAGLSVVIHEYLHWFLNNLTTPLGLFNREGIIETLVGNIMVSDDFRDWLEEVEDD